MVNTQVLQGSVEPGARPAQEEVGPIDRRRPEICQREHRSAHRANSAQDGRSPRSRRGVPGRSDGARCLGDFASGRNAPASYARQAADGAREGYQRVAEHAREGYNRISGEFERGYEVSREMIRDNPARSVATAFGVGVLLGVVVGLALRSR